VPARRLLRVAAATGSPGLALSAPRTLAHFGFAISTSKPKLIPIVDSRLRDAVPTRAPALHRSPLRHDQFKAVPGLGSGDRWPAAIESGLAKGGGDHPAEFSRRNQSGRSRREGKVLVDARRNNARVIRPQPSRASTAFFLSE